MYSGLLLYHPGSVTSHGAVELQLKLQLQLESPQEALKTNGRPLGRPLLFFGPFFGPSYNAQAFYSCLVGERRKKQRKNDDDINDAWLGLRLRPQENWLFL